MDHGALRVVQRQHSAALVRGEIAADQHPEPLVLPITVGGSAVLEVELQALEFTAQLEVHHSGHRVGAVGGRSPAGDHLDVLDEAERQRVQVDGAVGIGDLHAAPVQQDQHAVGAQAAQIAVRLAAVEAGVGLCVAHFGQALGCRELRHLPKGAIDGDLAGGRDRILAEGDDRAFRRVVPARDAGAGDDDFCHFLVGGGFGSLRGYALRGTARRAARLRLRERQLGARVGDSLEAQRGWVRGGDLGTLPPANHERARRRALGEETGALKQPVERLLRRVLALQRCSIDAGDDVLGEDDI